MIKFLSAFAVLTLLASSAFAGSVTNMDKTEHKLEFTYVGYTKESITLKAGETRYFQDPWLEISLDSISTTADYRSEFAIQNGKLVLMWIRESRGSGIF